MHCTNLPRPMISGCLALSPPATPIIGDSRSPLRSEWQNGPDQWLATDGLSTPLGFIASPLHRLVRPSHHLVVVTQTTCTVSRRELRSTLPRDRGSSSSRSQSTRK